MTIFPTKSPVNSLDKPKLKKRAVPGRLARLAAKLMPLLNTKKEVDKVYSNGYFENHYPDADELLKKKLHEKAMEAWANAAGFGSSDDDDSEEKESGDSKINLVINLR